MPTNCYVNVGDDLEVSHKYSTGLSLSFDNLKIPKCLRVRKQKMKREREKTFALKMKKKILDKKVFATLIFFFGEFPS